MRELTKSGLSAGLAMSVFGLQQMMNLFPRRRSNEAPPAAEAFNSVAQAMVDQSGGALRETFHVGDKIQRELVDMTFRFLTFRPLRPGESSTLGNAARQTTDQVRRWIDGVAAGVGTGPGTGMGGGGGCSYRGDYGPGDPWTSPRRTGDRDPNAAWRTSEPSARRADAPPTPEPDVQGWGPVPPEM